MNYQYITCEKNAQGVAKLALNRPQLRNAFNREMIAEITHEVRSLALEKEQVRLLLLRGEGTSFCAGADLNWMKDMVNYSEAENRADSEQLRELFDSINSFPAPVVGRVQGAAIGGGAGLVAVCDYVIADKGAKFAFSEVLLGLIPAVISPYVIAKIGMGHARATFLSGKAFSATLALSMGLIHEIEDGDEEVDYYLERVIESFLRAGPVAARACKSLLFEVAGGDRNEKELAAFTCGEIVKRRIHPEGQEGMRALLNKSTPHWVEK